MIKIHQSSRSRNDFNRKVAILPACRDIADWPATESAIRRRLRAQVSDELRYTTRGNRGAGKTTPEILTRIANARRDHTASIERGRFWAAAKAR